jgi:Holliday junction resolvase YEN1
VIKSHDHSYPIAQLAEEHVGTAVPANQRIILMGLLNAQHRQHGRPFRIAIDEADWRFNNLTQQQVYAIRESTYYFLFLGGYQLH